jgi:hypothetical protein
MRYSTGPALTVRAAQSYRLCSAEHSTDGPNISRTAKRKAAETLVLRCSAKPNASRTRQQVFGRCRTSQKRTNSACPRAFYGSKTRAGLAGEPCRSDAPPPARSRLPRGAGARRLRPCASRLPQPPHGSTLDEWTGSSPVSCSRRSPKAPAAAATPTCAAGPVLRTCWASAATMTSRAGRPGTCTWSSGNHAMGAGANQKPADGRSRSGVGE